jgi:hypothetical protein
MNEEENTTEHDESDVLITTPTCSVCGIPSTLYVDKDLLSLFLQGAHVQNVWPDWSNAQRELMLTGIHGDCWDRIFPTEE